MNASKKETRTFPSLPSGLTAQQGLSRLTNIENSLEQSLSRIARTQVQGGSHQFFCLKTELLCKLRDLRHSLMSKRSTRGPQRSASLPNYSRERIPTSKKEQEKIIYKVDDLLSLTGGLVREDLTAWREIQDRLSELVDSVHSGEGSAATPNGSSPASTQVAEREKPRETRYKEIALQQKMDADALFHDGRLVEAESHYRVALDLESENEDVLYGLGLNLYYQSRLTEALVYLLKVVELAPRYSVAHYRLGLTYHHLGQLNQAAESFKRCLALTPDYKMAHYHLGVVYARAGKTDQAIAEFSDQLDENLKDAASRRHLVDLLIAKRKQEDAEATKTNTESP